ncbi:MAG: hypothetical protein KGM15_03935 [Pseudomonadota bacterium]|nr:hypothetical protein [Pseudomonadota bacterium]
MITPVYVFSRLFVFWVELSTVEQQSTQNQKSVVSTATIKYSFHDFSGDWAAPQILALGSVINIQADDTKYGPFTADMFDPGKPYFQRVQAIVTEPSGYSQLAGLAPRVAEIEEKLTIVFGPSVNVTGAPSTDAIQASGSNGPAFAATLTAANRRGPTWRPPGGPGTCRSFPRSPSTPGSIQPSCSTKARWCCRSPSGSATPVRRRRVWPGMR